MLGRQIASRSRRPTHHWCVLVRRRQRTAMLCRCDICGRGRASGSDGWRPVCSERWHVLEERADR
jgi:hypothetical protein